LRGLERFDVELFEQPTLWWDFKSMATVAKAVNVSIMPHESLYLIFNVKTLIDLGTIGVLGLKTYRPRGGITNAKRLLEMARIMNIPCLMHDDLELGVSLAAARAGQLKLHFIGQPLKEIEPAKLSIREWVKLNYTIM